jgi:L-serine dehydratase
MRAAYRFVRELSHSALLTSVVHVRVQLYGSLALTGLGHGTDRGVLLGLMGKQPDEVDPAEIEEFIRTIYGRHEITLFKRRDVRFDSDDLVFHKDAVLPGHTNGMQFTAFDRNGTIISSRIYYSIGGGFITEDGESAPAKPASAVPLPEPGPFPLPLRTRLPRYRWAFPEEVTPALAHSIL